MHKHNEHLLIKNASYFSVTIASILILAKIYGYWITNSQSMLASLMDSTLDISYSILNVILIYFALQPPDYNHRFGHEKFQDLAIFSQALFFIGSSLLVIYSSICSILVRSNSSEPAIYNHEIGLYIMYFCIFMTLFLISYQTYVVKKTKSGIVVADKMHYVSDTLTNVVVIISIKVSNDFWLFDPLAGIFIGLYIGYLAYRLLKQAIKNLLDEEFSEEDKEKIKAIIRKYPEVKGLHEFKTRYAANKPFIQFHIEMDGTMPLNQAHAISEDLSQAILAEFVGGEVIIHQDPLEAKEEVNYREKI